MLNALPVNICIRKWMGNTSARATGQSESLVPELLARIGVPPAKLQSDLEKELARRHKIQGGNDPYAGRDLQKALDAAQFEANKLKDDYVSTEHLLLWSARRGESVAQENFLRAWPQA